MESTLKKILLLLIFLQLGVVMAQSKYSPMQQQYRWMKPQKFNDTLFFQGLYGTGNILRVDTNTWAVYRSVGTNPNAVGINDVLGLQDSLTAKQNKFVAGTGLLFSNDTLNVTLLPISSVQHLADSLLAKQNVLTAITPIYIVNDSIGIDSLPYGYMLSFDSAINSKQGTLTAGSGITISNDTISISAGSNIWTKSGTNVYATSTSDSVAIGSNTKTSKFYVVGGTARFEGFATHSSIVAEANSFGRGITAISDGQYGTALVINSTVLDTALKINNYGVDSISNDTLLAGQDPRSLVTEYAVKKYVDNKPIPTPNLTRMIIRDSVTVLSPPIVPGFEDTAFYRLTPTQAGVYQIMANIELKVQINDNDLDNDSLDYARTLTIIKDNVIEHTRRTNVFDIGLRGGTSISSGGAQHLETSTSDIARYHTYSITDIRQFDPFDDVYIELQVIYERYLGQTSDMDVKATFYVIRIQ